MWHLNICFTFPPYKSSIRSYLFWRLETENVNFRSTMANDDPHATSEYDYTEYS
jgi:hypothetical protein